ncbi:MAG: ASCH domain-containing protein [Acidimicrobiia bacterium]|nr:ASCH domain-containing protein [Acidimicrobiia bacterium]MYG59059.1 ASCH domain-containing protein [Acidimicrobiia bacterium]MYJ33193.1 ASCH domain-containing protein [Acidimicrobiia bacterium]
MTEEIEALDQSRMIVLSLRPRFAEAILAGTKTVELRRTRPRIEVPTRALLYATTPIRALLGTCIITEVRSADLTALWREYGSSSELSHSEFKHYFDGLDVGTALTLAHQQPLDRMVPLQDLRANPRGFRPPQSFAYVDAKTGHRLLGMAA